MEKHRQLGLLYDTGIIAIMRAAGPAGLYDAASALRDGGVRFVEVTMTTPGALGVIETVSRQLPDIVMGAGTVLDSCTARSAILAGAQFIVCPTLSPEVIKLCNRYSIVVLPGAYTPTEIVSAWECGADMVKLFPASMGGPALVRTLRAPFPQIPLVPVGGVELGNVAEFISAGAAAVAVGGMLARDELLRERNWTGLAALARDYIGAIASARDHAA